MKERLQKILSQAGVCSRRAAEQYITEGRVTVNGVRAGLGDGADSETDRVEVDGRPLPRAGARTYLMLYKPRGYVTTLRDDRGRRTVAELVDGCSARVWPVGRLDYDSEGLLLMTDDGAFTNALIHPSAMLEKEYYVTVTGALAPALPMLNAPMALDGERFRAARVTQRGTAAEGGELSFVICEGKNRQIRRMCAAAGLEVRRLVRVREGTLHLDGALRPGQWRLLERDELERLKNEIRNN